MTYLSSDKYGEPCGFTSPEEFCNAVEDCGFQRPQLRPGTDGGNVWYDEDDEIALTEVETTEFPQAPVVVGT